MRIQTVPQMLGWGDEKSQDKQTSWSFSGNWPYWWACSILLWIEVGTFMLSIHKYNGFGFLVLIISNSTKELVHSLHEKLWTVVRRCVFRGLLW